MNQGGTMALPRGIPHRYQNVGSDEGHLLVVVVPGGFRKIFHGGRTARAVDRKGHDNARSKIQRHSITQRKWLRPSGRPRPLAR